MLIPKSKLFIFILLGLFMISSVSALGFDNSIKPIKQSIGESYNLGGKDIVYRDLWETYPNIEIKNAFGFGDTLFKGSLIEHTNSCGSDCSSEVNVEHSGGELIQDIRFYDVTGNGKVLTTISSFVIYVDDSIYTIGDELKKGDYTLRIEGKKRYDKDIDWVIKTQGIWIDDWAVWQGVNDLVISSSQELCGDYVNYNNIIINNSATITICSKNGTANTGELNLHAFQNLTIESGVVIEGSSKGYAGGSAGFDSSGGNGLGTSP